MKGLTIIAAAAALALTPSAAVAKKPLKAKDRSAKTEQRAEHKKDTAQQRCRDERKELGAAAFAAKYGKPRTKGSAKAKAKQARAAMGRCVSQAAKAIKAEREAAEAAEEEETLEYEAEEQDSDEETLEGEHLDDGPVHDGKHGAHDLPGGKHTLDDPDDDDDEEDDPEVGLGDDVDLED